MDMCFAAVGKAIFGQPEVAIGLVPGGGSTQRLPRLMGRGRALKVLLGCNDFSAELAERYGYINRALPADELTPFVEKLAHRIASFPAHAIAHAKAAVDMGAFSSLAEGLLVEAATGDRSAIVTLTLYYALLGIFLSLSLSSLLPHSKPASAAGSPARDR